MSYKVILNNLDSSPATTARSELACRLANDQSAHLIGLAATSLAAAGGDAHRDSDGSASAVAAHRMDQGAQQEIARFEHQCAKEAVKSFESRRVASEPLDAVKWHERFCDLVVIGRETPKTDTGFSPLSFTEKVLLASSRPILIVPSQLGPNQAANKVVIAWDGSPSAARAVLGAMPLLEKAASVDIAIVHKTGAEAMDEGIAGSEMSLYLARHGISANICECSLNGDVPTTLLSQALEIGASYMVMGGYGHSPLRERLIGGTTRAILNKMPIPILMTH